MRLIAARKRQSVHFGHQRLAAAHFADEPFRSALGGIAEAALSRLEVG